MILILIYCLLWVLYDFLKEYFHQFYFFLVGLYFFILLIYTSYFFMYLLLAFGYQWMTWHVPPLMPFSAFKDYLWLPMQHNIPYWIQIESLFMKRIILTSILSGLFVYSRLFFHLCWICHSRIMRAQTEVCLSKIIKMRRKDNLRTWHRHEHQQDQIEKKMSSLKKNPLQFFMNGNVLHNRNENHHYNYIRRLFT